MRPGMNDPDTIAQKLRDLPVDAAPPYDWAEFQRRAQQRGTEDDGRTGHATPDTGGAQAQAGSSGRPILSDMHGDAVVELRQRARAWRRAAFAATFAFVVAAAALWVRFDSSDRAPRVADRKIEGGVLTEEAIVRNNPARSYAAPDAGEWLANLPAEPAIVRVDTHFAVADLEDRIAWLDDALSSAQLDSTQTVHIRALRRERAQLINSLAQVRYAETLAAGLP